MGEWVSAVVCDKINEVRPFTHTLNTEHTEVTLGNFRTMKREAPLSHKLDDPFEELGGDLKRPGFVVGLNASLALSCDAPTFAHLSSLKFKRDPPFPPVRFASNPTSFVYPKREPYFLHP